MKKISICSIIILLIFVILNMSYTVYGAEIKVVHSIQISSGIIDPGDFDPGDVTINDAQPIMKFSETIINAIGVIGTIVSVIALIIIGMKYLTGSVSEKAEYKKTMIPYLIGVFIFFAITQLLTILLKYVNGLNDI